MDCAVASDIILLTYRIHPYKHKLVILRITKTIHVYELISCLFIIILTWSREDEKQSGPYIRWLLMKPPDMGLHCFQKVYKTLKKCSQ